MFLHADSEDSDQTGRMPRLPDAQADPSLRWTHSRFVGFVMSWLIYSHPCVCLIISRNLRHTVIYFTFHIKLAELFFNAAWVKTPHSDKHYFFSHKMFVS